MLKVESKQIISNNQVKIIKFLRVYIKKHEKEERP